MEYYITLAIVAMVLYGIRAIIYKIAPEIDYISLTFFASLFLTISTFLFWIFSSNKIISFQGVIFAAIAGLIASIAFISYMKAIKIGKVSTASTLRGLSFAVTVLLAILFLGEKITIVKVLGILFAIIAIILLSI